MNWVAGWLPRALGEQGLTPLWLQPPSGSGKTAPYWLYWLSLVATGEARAAAGSRNRAARTAARIERMSPATAPRPKTCGLLPRQPGAERDLVHRGQGLGDRA